MRPLILSKIEKFQCPDYLKKSLSDIQSGVKPKTLSVEEKAEKKRFDDYFESEVKKEKERQKKNKK